jgi:hypothetical protein
MAQQMSAHNGWNLTESGPPDAAHTVLLLPGALCTALFFEDLMAEPRLRDASIRLVATTVPGVRRDRAARRCDDGELRATRGQARSGPGL